MSPVVPTVYQGLTQEQVQQRLRDGLGNAVTVDSGRTVGQIIFHNTFTFFNLVFVVLALVLALAGSTVLNMTFMVVVIINTAIGCIHEIRAKRAVDALRLVAQQQLRTVRDGKVQTVRSDLLVRDDIVLLGSGDQICADGMVLEGQLYVNESLITGEADAVEKGPESSLRSGSFVTGGSAAVRLTHVGNQGYAARLAAEAKADPRAAKSEMMLDLDRLIRIVGITLIPVGLLMIWNQLRNDASMLTGVEATVAALVGMIPEGLYLLTSVAVAVSALKLTRQRVLVRDMNCIEALARVDVLCMDKTGTITEPEMEVERLIPLGSADTDISQVLTALYCREEPDNQTAAAIGAYFAGEPAYKCSHYVPFSSEYKWCGGVLEGLGNFVVGAPDRLAGDTLQAETRPWLEQGCRLLLVAAYGEVPTAGQLRPELVTPLGLLVLSNKLRPCARQTVEYFQQQSVTVKVISGDDPVAASRVADRAGIANAGAYVDVSSLDTPEQLLEAAANNTVFGRVTPHKKKQLLQALKQLGHTVAMTGDGVNDVLAMKHSDCAIAMGSGAQAASQVARLILLDSDFAAMPGIVGEGRRVINNIQRAATLFLVKNIFSMGLALITILAGLRFPLEPFNLSIVSALTIGVPGFFLALEPNYQRVTGRFLSTVLRRALPGGLTDVIMVLSLQLVMQAMGLGAGDIQAACTAVLGAVGLSVLFQVSKPFSRIRILLWIAMAVAFVGAYFVLPPITGYLQITDLRTLWVMLGAVAVSPCVFGLLQLVFSFVDKRKSA